MTNVLRACISAVDEKNIDQLLVLLNQTEMEALRLQIQGEVVSARGEGGNCGLLSD